MVIPGELMHGHHLEMALCTEVIFLYTKHLGCKTIHFSSHFCVVVEV